MSTRQPSDNPDIDVSALHREVGADSVAGTPMRRIQPRQQRREAEAAALHGPNTQSGTAPARVQNPHFEPLASGRQFDDEYDESEYASSLASVWQPTAAHPVNAQQASTSHHVNAQSAANPFMIDADTLARAFTQYTSMTSGVSRNVPEKIALAVAKSEKPKWDTQKEPFHTFKRRVLIWAESLKIENLLTGPPLGAVVDFECHDAARRIILLSLSAADTDYTADTTYLYEAWKLLLERHEPSRAVEVSELYQKLTFAAQNGRPMGEHVQQCMTWRNRLKALGAELPHELFVQRLLEVDIEYMFMRAPPVSMSPQQIVAALMEQYRLFQQRKQQRRTRSAPAGRGHPKNRPRGQGPPALAAINRQGEQRVCHNCGKPGHLRAKRPNLHPEVRKYLALGFGRGRGGGGGGPGQGNGGQAGQGGRGGQGGAAVAAMTIQRYDELLELPHSNSPVQPLNFLIESGSDISLCWNYDLFTFVEPCSMKSCIPVGSTTLIIHTYIHTPLSIDGVGVVRFCLGSYVDHLGQRHPLDMEIPNVYYVPQSSFNILSTTHLKRYQITLNTQFDNDVLIMPGLPSQVTGIWGDWHQVIGPRGYPSINITLGNKKPVMRTFPVDSGTAWKSAACAVDQVREPGERHNIDVAALKENKKGF